jgi:hypothetical protein
MYGGDRVAVKVAVLSEYSSIPLSEQLLGAQVETVTTHYTLYTIHYTLYTIHYTLYSIHYTLYTIHKKTYTIHYTLYAIHHTLYTLAIHSLCTHTTTIGGGSGPAAAPAPEHCGLVWGGYRAYFTSY